MTFLLSFDRFVFFVYFLFYFCYYWIIGCRLVFLKINIGSSNNFVSVK